MALTYSELQAVSDKGYDKLCTQQAYDQSPFWKKLELNDQIQEGGSKWAWTVRTEELGLANAVGPRDAISYVSKETRTLAEVDPRFYICPAVLHWDEQQANKGKAQIIKLVEDKTKELKEDFMKRLATDLYTANPNGIGIIPITTIVDSASTYAGIAVADASSWAATEDAATTALALYGGSTSLSGMCNAARFGTKKVTMHITNKNMRSTFESILESQKQFVDKLGDKQMADAGFENVAFHGAGVFDDAFCPDGTWLGLNMDDMYILVDPEYYLKVSKWEPLDQVGFPHAVKKTMGAVLNIKCTSRRTNFKYTALDETL
jgi:hypothetical protein